MEEMPTKIRERSQKICPWPELGAAGDCRPSPAGMPELARVGYEVQPAAGAPPSTKKLIKISVKAGHMNQYDSMFSFGKAMSRAPTISGMVKLAKAPTSLEMTTKRIRTRA